MMKILHKTVRSNYNSHFLGLQAAPVDKDYCGDRDTNYPVESEAGVSPFLSKAFHNVQLSAVVSSGVDVHSLVYLGTRSGQLLKVGLPIRLDNEGHWSYVKRTEMGGKYQTTGRLDMK